MPESQIWFSAQDMVVLDLKHVPKVLDLHLSSYAKQGQKSDGALRISSKITIAS